MGRWLSSISRIQKRTMLLWGVFGGEGRKGVIEKMVEELLSEFELKVVLELGCPI